MRASLVLLLLTGCASPDYEDAIHLRPQNNPWSQAREQMVENALRDRIAIDEKARLRKEHVARMREHMRQEMRTNYPAFLLPK